MAEILNGITVLDLTQVGFGPWATQVLGDFGADVVKVEAPGHGDLSRTFDLHLTEEGGQSAYFMASNRNKRSIAVDLGKPEGRDLVVSMAASVDVVVHNFRPGVAERLGIGYQQLSENNPSLVYCWGSGFGRTGPLAGSPGQDVLAQGLSGFAAKNTADGKNAHVSSVAVADYAGAMVLVQGVLLGLVDRYRTGRGRELYTSLLDTMLSMQQMDACQLMLRDKETDWVRHYLVGPLWAKDGQILIVGVFRPNPLQDICRALEIEDLSADERYDTPQKQRERKGEIWQRLQEVIGQMTKVECLTRLEENDVLCSELLDLGAALQSEQAKSNGAIVEFTDRVHGQVRAVATPLKTAGGAVIEHRTPPRLGEHTREVLQEFGIAAARVDELIQSEVVREH